MKLKNLLEQLNKMVSEDPKLANYVIKFRGEQQEEHVSHFHTEGRVLYLSDVWAQDLLNPIYGKAKDNAKLVSKLKAFMTDKECLAAEKAKLKDS